MRDMEYRKRRNRRRPNPEGNGGTLLRALILVIIFGASIWLIFGTNAGERIKNGGAKSLIDSCRDRRAAAPSASPLLIPSEKPTPAPTVSPTGETCEVKLPGIEIHMIEMGIYSDSAVCAARAEELRSMGAAGYVFNDGGSLRLIASAYSDKASAESVIERLRSEGYECSLHSVQTNGVELLITAQHERLLPIRTAFDTAYETVTALDELAIDFDKNQRTTEYGLGIINEINTNLLTSSSAIAAQSAQNPMLAVLSGYYSDLIRLAEAARENVSSRTAFSSYLKAFRTEASLRYLLLLGEIGGTA